MNKIADISKPTKSKLSETETKRLIEVRIKIEKQISQQIEACEKSSKIIAQDLLITILPKS